MTQLFSDGFESGNFSAWTGTAGSPTIVSSPLHHGSNAMRTNGNGVYANKTFTEQTTVHLRCYVQLGTLPTAELHRVMRFLKGSTFVCGVGFRNIAGTLQIELQRNYPSATFDYYNFSYTAGTWYCLELKFVRHATNGEYRVYLNGSEVITVTGLDTSSVTGADTIRVGSPYTQNTINTYADCVVVSDSYIGPEASTALQTVTDTLSAAEVTLRHKALFLEDSAALAEEAGRPTRELQVFDVAGFGEGVFVDRVLQVMDEFSLVEVAEVGAGTIKKTRLFLVLGDFALELAGD